MKTDAKEIVARIVDECMGENPSHTADRILDALEARGWHNQAKLTTVHCPCGNSITVDIRPSDELELRLTEKLEATNRWQAENLRTVTAERDALQARLDVLTSDTAVEAARLRHYKLWGFPSDDETMREVITAAIEATELPLD